MIYILLLFLLVVLVIIYRLINRSHSLPYADGKLVKVRSNMNLPTKKNYNRKIECVIVCSHYGDFLRWTLPFTRNYFDKTVVVTTPDDLETQEICSYWGVQCVITEEFYHGGDAFNKARGINIGLKYLELDGWVVHMDADIYLPPKTRNILQLLPLNEKSIYSIDRLNCHSFTEWIMYFEQPENQHGMDGLLRQGCFEKGSRLVNLNRDGYVGMGYFQYWNPEGSGIWEYPDKHGAADRTDILFSYNFARENRVLLPEIVGIHLDSGISAMGENWKGRKTKRFGLT